MMPQQMPNLSSADFFARVCGAQKMWMLDAVSVVTPVSAASATYVPEVPLAA